MEQESSGTIEDAHARSLEWLRFIYPVTEHFADQVRKEDFSGKTISGWMHLLPDAILLLEPFVEAGAKVRVGACNADSTNQTVVEQLRDRGVEVYAGGDRDTKEYQDTLRKFVQDSPDVICDMGGELAEMATLCGDSSASGRTSRPSRTRCTTAFMSARRLGRRSQP